MSRPTTLADLPRGAMPPPPYTADERLGYHEARQAVLRRRLAAESWWRMIDALLRLVTGEVLRVKRLWAVKAIGAEHMSDGFYRRYVLAGDETALIGTAGERAAQYIATKRYIGRVTMRVNNVTLLRPVKHVPALAA